MSRSTPRLSEVARELVIPDGIVTTGWPRIKHRLSTMGVEFDPWQEQACQVVLGKRRDGKYASTVGGVVWSIPRQVGKTFTVGMLLVAMCIEFPGLKVVWTSHHNRTTTNSFRAMQGYVRRKEVVPHMPPGGGVRTANGEQEISFRNGSIIMFGAREFGFGRGMDAIDVIVFDEAQILGVKALEDMVPATNQARHDHGALLWFIGTPPKPGDDSEAFTAKRDRALAGKSSDQMYLEFAADPDADPDDGQQWRRANPSYPSRTPRESMMRMRENLGSDEAWMREALGVWGAKSSRGVIPFDAWTACRDDASMAADRLALGVEVGPDLAYASVSIAGRRADGDWHVELVESRKGAAWMPAYVHDLLELNPDIGAVVADVGGPVQSMVEHVGSRWFLRGPDVRLHALRVKELGVACSRVVDGVVTGWLRNLGQHQLDAAVQAAGKRALSDTGMWVYSRKSTTSDITPIQSATYALWGAQNIEAATKSVRRARGRSKVVIL